MLNLRSRYKSTDGSAQSGKLAAGALGFLLWIVLVSMPPAAATVKIGGPFSLITPEGKTVTDQTFHGRWLLVYFGYTSCPDSCPTAMVEIAKTLESLGAEARTVTALFITVDPKHDTPRLMGEYTRSFDRRILGLTGTSSQIAAVTKSYGVYIQWHDIESGSALIDHSTYTYLMDPNGDFVRVFERDASTDQIAAAIRSAITGASPGASKRKTAEKNH